MDTSRSELFVRLLTRHQDDLFRYIFSLLPHEDDARDVLQETSVALSRKFAEYDASRPFAAWACRFAFLEVLKLKDRNRRAVPPMDSKVLEALAGEREAHEGILQSRLRVLDDCLAKLPPADRELIAKRYGGGFNTDRLTAVGGASRRTLFRNLERIRRALMRCIDEGVRS